MDDALELILYSIDDIRQPPVLILGLGRLEGFLENQFSSMS